MDRSAVISRWRRFNDQQTWKGWWLLIHKIKDNPYSKWVATGNNNSSLNRKNEKKDNEKQKQKTQKQKNRTVMENVYERNYWAFKTNNVVV
jgi:hypothetical protein